MKSEHAVLFAPPRSVGAPRASYANAGSAFRLRLLLTIVLTGCGSSRSASNGGTSADRETDASAHMDAATSTPELEAGAPDAASGMSSSAVRETTDSATSGAMGGSYTDASVVSDADVSTVSLSTAAPVTVEDASATSPVSSRDLSSNTAAPLETTYDDAGTSADPDAAVRPPVAAPNLTDPAQFELVNCAIEARVDLAAKIPMVGVATFDTDFGEAERAIIQFGTADEYTLQAPVAWEELGHRTLLLGMPSDTEVHYRVIVIKGEHACVGPDLSYHTGGPPTAGFPVRVTTIDGPSLVEPSPGFVVATRSNVAYIVDKRGYVVWAHRFPTALTRATLSWDGKYMLARDMGPFNATSGGNIFRVGMDGQGERRLEVTGGHHHDFTATPDGIVYIGKDEAGECDSLFTARVDGSESAPLVNLGVVFDKFALGPQALAPERCHVNYVRYYDETKSYSVSDREKDAIAFFSTSGVLLGSIGAKPSQATPNHIFAEGANSAVNSPWRVQHGHDMYAPNKLVVWSNGVFQNGKSRMLHYTISGGTAKLDWQYTGAGNSPTLSDGIHLPNGNFLGTNSASGMVHEIDAARNLVRSYSGLARGYPVHRTTLYGPPPGM